jgi:hypothetical protein
MGTTPELIGTMKEMLPSGKIMSSTVINWVVQVSELKPLSTLMDSEFSIRRPNLVPKMLISVSTTLPKISNWIAMFREMKIYKYIHHTDCLMMDGAYKPASAEVIEAADRIGLSLGEDNFSFPIRKITNVDLDPSEAKLSLSSQHFQTR